MRMRMPTNIHCARTCTLVGDVGQVNFWMQTWSQLSLRGMASVVTLVGDTLHFPEIGDMALVNFQ